MDHAGATLPTQSQIDSFYQLLKTHILPNPHSTHGSDDVLQVRLQVLKFLNASPDEYSVVFTSGASSSLRIIGENYKWSHQSVFAYTLQNHASVIGIREYPLEKGAKVEVVMPNFLIEEIESRHTHQQHQQQQDNSIFNLFAFPGECNFSGQKFDLDIINVIKGNKLRNEKKSQMVSQFETFMDSHQRVGKWKVLLDAAKFAGTNELDLSKYPADFVTLSFYKICGFPTGLGALIIRNDSMESLEKKYFGGGTLSAWSALSDFKIFRNQVSHIFEDGTIPFHSVFALKYGLELIQKVGMKIIQEHVKSLTQSLYTQLLELKHWNNEKVCEIYGVKELGFYY